MLFSLVLSAQTLHLVTANPNNTFSPAELTIEAGDTVRWQNNGGSHNVNGSTAAYPSNPEGFSNGNASSSAWTFDFIFTIPGDYDYHCDPHLAVGMTGKITVTGGAPGVVISEIMYNPPGLDSDLEYIELYNNSDNAVNLINYSFAAGIEFTFPGYNLGAGEYVIVAADSVFFENAFGIPAFEVDGGGLSNGGELIQLVDGDGNVVDEVSYQPDGDWPAGADGAGASLVLCDLDSDNNDPANWQAASTPTGVDVGGIPVFANPGAASQCATGAIVGFGESGATAGEGDGDVFIPVVLRMGGAGTTTVDLVVSSASTATPGMDYILETTTVTFAADAVEDTVLVLVSLIDDSEMEVLEDLVIELANPSAEATIDVLANDYVLIIQDNDEVTADLVITEIMYNPPESGTDSLEFIEVYNNGDAAVDLQGYNFTQGVNFTFPSFMLDAGGYVVIAVDSVAIETVFGVQAFQFDGALGNSGEPIELSSPGGMVVDLVEYTDDPPWPTEADGDGPSLVFCDPSLDNNDGANWQASSTDSGVMIEGLTIFASPGAADSCVPPGETIYTAYDIGQVNTVNADGVADSLEVLVELQGVVHGINFRPNGLEFVIIDSAGDGIWVFNSNENFGYTVQEGDEVSIKGEIDQFRGLTQIRVDDIALVSTGNDLQEPSVVTALGEDTEAQLIKLENVTLVDPADWEADGGSFNVPVTDGTNTYLVRIDGDTELADMAAPEGPFNVTGLGGQFDNDSPFTDGYQLLPRYAQDIELVSAVVDPQLAQLIRIYPNPAESYLWIRTEQPFDGLRMSDAQGRRVLSVSDLQPMTRLDISQLPKGMYTITFIQDDRIWATRIIKQ